MKSEPKWRLISLTSSEAALRLLTKRNASQAIELSYRQRLPNRGVLDGSNTHNSQVQ
ncbi:MAG: hypothetical protein ACON4U_15385 [Myxococcota bacterium]